MIVFAAGMRRAGSTAIFNIARLLATMTGKGRALTLGQHRKEIIVNYFNTNEIVVVKAHKLNDAYIPLLDNTLALMTVRDLREICCSVMRLGMGDYDVARSLINLYVEEQQSWNDHKRIYSNRYEDWVHDLAGETKRISDFMGVGANDGTINAVADMCSMDRMRKVAEFTSGTHHINFINRNHITSGALRSWDTELTAEQADEITQTYKWWLELYDYPC